MSHHFVCVRTGLPGTSVVPQLLFRSAGTRGTLVACCKNVTAETVNDLLHQFDIPYSHIKKFNKQLTNQSKARLATVEKVDTILW